MINNQMTTYQQTRAGFTYFYYKRKVLDRDNTLRYMFKMIVVQLYVCIILLIDCNKSLLSSNKVVFEPGRPPPHPRGGRDMGPPGGRSIV